MRYSFGGVSDQFGATSWPAHETGMVPNLLSCEIDMTEWLKEKYKGSGASEARGKISVRVHTRAQMAFIAIQWTLFIEQRPRYFVILSSQIVCL